MHLEYWKSLDGPGIPTRHGTWTPGCEYVQWYDNANALNFREYYNLASDPYQLANLLRDGTTVNDPNVAPRQTQTDADRTCAGSTCP